MVEDEESINRKKEVFSLDASQEKEESNIKIGVMKKKKRRGNKIKNGVTIEVMKKKKRLGEKIKNGVTIEVIKRRG